MGYCKWDYTSQANRLYHDTEWGVPLHDDLKQFEFLMLEVMQCGLSWELMIKKRSIFRSCFDGFDFDRIASYGEDDILRILSADGMIRSRRKIEAVINNARCFQKIRAAYGSFSNYLWNFAGGKTILYDKHELGYIPVSNGLSAQISKDLKKRGFKYVGAITIYSHLQACGIINDHASDCPRFKFILENFPVVRLKNFQEEKVTYYGD